MSELPEKTIQVRFNTGEVRDLLPEEIWFKAETETGRDCFVHLANLVTFLNPPKPEKLPRLFNGVLPTWSATQLGGFPTILNAKGEVWAVSARGDYKKKPLWRDVKVYAHLPVPDKANYSLSWNTKLGYFAEGDALKLMAAYRSELLSEVTRFLLNTNWPK